MLEIGMIVKLPDSGKVKVVEINEGSATVQSLSKSTKDFKTLNGEEVSFESSGKRWTISINSDVEIIGKE